MKVRLLHFVITKKALRFTLSGLFTTILHVLIAYTFMQAVLPAPIFANSVAFLIATVFSYFINTKWSFSCILYKRNFLRFILVSFIGLFVTIFISRTAQYYGLHYGYGIGFVVCIVPPVTFFLHNIWTYR